MWCFSNLALQLEFNTAPPSLRIPSCGSQFPTDCKDLNLAFSKKRLIFHSKSLYWKSAVCIPLTFWAKCVDCFYGLVLKKNIAKNRSATTFSHFHTILQTVPFSPWPAEFSDMLWNTLGAASREQRPSAFGKLCCVTGCHWLQGLWGPLPWQEDIEQPGLRGCSFQPHRAERSVGYCRPSALDVGLEHSPSLQLQIVWDPWVDSSASRCLGCWQTLLTGIQAVKRTF